MFKATNPITGNEFELPENVEVSEIVTDPDDGVMLEVTEVNNGVVTLKEIKVEEDWGE